MICRTRRLLALAVISIGALGTMSASADVITFTYDNPNATVDHVEDFGNVLGFGIGTFSGLTMPAFMTISFDTNTAPTEVYSLEQLCSGTCGLSGSASINGYAIPIGFPGSHPNNLAFISQTGALHEEIATVESDHTVVPASQADLTHEALFSFDSNGQSGQIMGPPLLQSFAFHLLSSITLVWADECVLVDFCAGFDAQMLLQPNDPHVTITVTDTPEPSAVAVIATALLSLLCVGLIRGRASAS